MSYETLIVDDSTDTHTLTINRPDFQNSINSILLHDLHRALDRAEDNPHCRAIVLQGKGSIFCAGLDFKELISWNFEKQKIQDWATKYMALLRRLSMMSILVVTNLDGKVFAGGTGLVAASDYVLATPRSDFKLTEALWGLLPAMVSPYLIRRVGFQKAYTLTLTAQTLSAQEAHSIHLVDEISEQPDEALSKLIQRFKRLDNRIIAEIKHYFRKMWIVDKERESVAVDEITYLLQNAKVQDNICEFVRSGVLPWK